MNDMDKEQMPKPEQEHPWPERLDDLETVRQTTIESRLVAVPTPVEGNNQVLVKLESEQEIKSFKIRGATLAMARHLDELRECGVVADSGGNHAQAVALAGKNLGVHVRIIMANVVPEDKVRATRHFGAKDGTFDLDTTPNSFVDAKVRAKAFAEVNGWKYLSPYDDPDIVDGTATLATEIMKQFEAADVPPPDATHVPVGGGGLISGFADVYRELGISGLYGHGMTGADSAARSLHSPEPVPVEGTPNPLVEGLAVKVIGNEVHQRMRDGKITDIYTSELRDVGKSYTWYIEHVLPILGVDTDNEEAVWANLPEVSSMVAVSGLFKHIRETGARNQTHLVVISGGNINREKAKIAMAAA